MRLFVAVVPPAEAKHELGATIRSLTLEGPEPRWIAPEQWHLTLAFLGEVAEQTVPELIERLGRVAARAEPLQLSLRTAGQFGDRVLWVAVDGQVAELRRLASSVRAAARRTGLPTEKRAYRPHLTVARSRPGADLRTAAAALAGFTGSPWTAAELFLVRSELGKGPGGTARHEPVRGWTLGG